jgi:hypothetical protein
MILRKIEKVFASRRMPAEVVEPASLLQLDSDVEEALWFAGHDWHDITWKDWKEHSAAIIFFSRDAFAYYLPSLLLLSLQNPRELLESAQTLIWELDRSPSTEGWNDHFTRRFLGLRSEEYDVLKEWLLQMCEYAPYRGYGLAASGPGDTFGRAYDTVDLLQKETERRHLADGASQERNRLNTTLGA